MAKREPVVRISGLTKRFGDFTVLDGLNLEVHPGEAVALTGRNGSGKSTLLRMLVGADQPDEGSVQVSGEPMFETSAKIRRDMAVVIDDLDFFPDLSVVEHLDLLARAHGLADPDAVVDEVLHEVQLVAQSGQLPGTLSSGQRRRLALATAFVRPRKLLVLDEPEQRLDVEGVRWLAERLVAERSDGLAVVFASHEPHLVDTVATRIVTLGGGRDDDGDDTPAVTDGPAGSESGKAGKAGQAGQTGKGGSGGAPSKKKVSANTRGKGRRKGGRR